MVVVVHQASDDIGFGVVQFSQHIWGVRGEVHQLLFGYDFMVVLCCDSYILKEYTHTNLLKCAYVDRVDKEIKRVCVCGGDEMGGEDNDRRQHLPSNSPILCQFHPCFVLTVH